MSIFTVHAPLLTPFSFSFLYYNLQAITNSTTYSAFLLNKDGYATSSTFIDLGLGATVSLTVNIANYSACCTIRSCNCSVWSTSAY